MVIQNAMRDRIFRLAYRGAYKLMRIYWSVAHPRKHGALVLIWNKGEVLLVKNSYVPYHSSPGGYVRADETGREAAVREVREETAINIRSEDLVSALDREHDWEGKREHIEIFEWETPERPRINIDNREVVAAAFYSPDRALALNLFPPLREVIARKQA